MQHDSLDANAMIAVTHDVFLMVGEFEPQPKVGDFAANDRVQEEGVVFHGDGDVVGVLVFQVQPHNGGLQAPCFTDNPVQECLKVVRVVGHMACLQDKVSIVVDFDGFAHAWFSSLYSRIKKEFQF